MKIQEFNFLQETPWGSLGSTIPTSCTSSKEIIERCDIKWDAEVHFLTSVVHPNNIDGWREVCRSDSKHTLGVVNKAVFYPINNIDTFLNVEYGLQNKYLYPVCAGELRNGQMIFGVFKYDNDYLNSLGRKLDDISTYVVIINDHIKGDEKISVIYVPILESSNLMLSHLLPKNQVHVRIPSMYSGQEPRHAYNMVTNHIIQCIEVLEKIMKKYKSMELDIDDISTYLDEFLDLEYPTSDNMTDAKIMNIMNMRNTIENCVGNFTEDYGYNDSVLSLLLGIFDFTQHYFKGNDKLLDLDYRMNILPGMKTDERQNLIRDLFKFISKITNNQKN